MSGKPLVIYMAVNNMGPGSGVSFYQALHRWSKEPLEIWDIYGQQARMNKAYQGMPPLIPIEDAKEEL